MAIFTTVLLVIMGLADIGRDFVTNRPDLYFRAQPQELLWVACIVLVGGIGVALGCRWKPETKRFVRLIALLSALGFSLTMGGYVVFVITRLNRVWGEAPLSATTVLELSLVWAGSVCLLGFEFWRTLRQDNR
jgi:CHASE2 domain-containing sensor protein